jgi:hypothetical protein
MPNHVTTVCTVRGPEESVERFCALHLAGEFDFNTVIPMPEILRDSESSSDVDMGLLALRGRVPSNTFLPRDEQSRIEFYSRGAARTRSEFLEWVKRTRPEALAKAERASRALDETGFASWYEWAPQFWGTKWSAYDFERRARSEGQVVFKFETAWAFPEPIFRKLALLFPDIVFAVVSFDEGWSFACTGSFGGENDFAVVGATAELYEAAYGRKPDVDDDEDDAIGAAN